MNACLDQTIWPRCLVCFRREVLKPFAGTTLCDSCRADFAELGVIEGRQLQGRTIVTLARYRGPIRQLLLRAKVEGDHVALAFLETWGCRSFLPLMHARGVGAVVAAPSSLWSRLRGRLDVAHAIASAIAVALDVPMIPGPPYLHWRLKKRSRLGPRDQRSFSPAPTPRAAAPLIAWMNARWRKRWGERVIDQTILVVDDVVTTGGTLTEVATALEFEGAARVRGFVLASALA